MTVSEFGYAQFSSTIRLELRTKQGVVLLASIGPNEVIPRECVELEPGDADVVMDVDGETFVWPVRLVSGAVPFDRVISTVQNGEMRRDSSIANQDGPTNP